MPYKVRGDHQISIPYKVWGDHKSLTVTRFPHWTLIVKILHIDSYKVPAVDSNHIIHVGDGMSLPQRTGGFNLH